jgi:hypothetical protein
MLQWDGMVMVEMEVLVMMMMMMSMISPLREEISLADFCLPESFSLSVFSAPQRRRSLSLSSPLDLGFRG